VPLSAGSTRALPLPKLTWPGSARVTQTAVPYAMLATLVLIVSTREKGVFTVAQLNIWTLAALPLVLIAAGQMIVVLSGGIDLSVGGVVSLTTTLAATHFGHGGVHMGAWIVLLIAGGWLAGALNGLLVAVTGMDPFIVTLSTWSFWGGCAFLVLATDGGSIPQSLVDFGNASHFGLSNAFLALPLIALAWAVFTRTRSGIAIKSVGSDRNAAFLAGISVGRTLMMAYGLSGALSVLAGLFLVTQTTSGSPTIGAFFILQSIAAVVIGGNRLGGGYATMAGTIIASFILVVIDDVTFGFSLTQGWNTVLTGGLLILTVLANGIVAVVSKRRLPL